MRSGLVLKTDSWDGGASGGGETLGVSVFCMTTSGLDKLSGELAVDGRTVFPKGDRDAGASYVEGLMAGPAECRATFHVKGSDCGASWIRCINSMAARAKLPCSNPESSQPRALCRV